MDIKQPGQPYDSMIVQTRAHHVNLSMMADRKAGMLITIAALVITLSAPHVIEPQLKYSAFVMIGFNLVTILLAVYAAMPKMKMPSDKKNDLIHSVEFNPLFFGHFIHLSLEEYKTKMQDLLNDPNLAYEMQILDIYEMGKFLETSKYRFLKLAYISFLLGIFASAAVLLVTHYFHGFNLF